MRSIITLSLLLFLQPCFAAITVVTENFPNFQYLDENGELTGTVVDKVKSGLDKSGVDYEVSVNSWSISYNAALRDSNTCIFSMARLPAREDKFTWVAKIGGFSASFYSFKSEQVKITSIDEAKKYRIAVLKNNYSHIYLKENGFDERNQLILLDSFDNIYDVLKSRRSSIDLVILSDEQFKHERDNDNTLEDLKPILKLPVGTPQLFFACNKNINPVTLEKLNKGFADID